MPQFVSKDQVTSFSAKVKIEDHLANGKRKNDFIEKYGQFALLGCDFANTHRKFHPCSNVVGNLSTQRFSATNGQPEGSCSHSSYLHTPAFC